MYIDLIIYLGVQLYTSSNEYEFRVYRVQRLHPTAFNQTEYICIDRETLVTA